MPHRRRWMQRRCSQSVLSLEGRSEDWPAWDSSRGLMKSNAFPDSSHHSTRSSPLAAAGGLEGTGQRTCPTLGASRVHDPTPEASICSGSVGRMIAHCGQIFADEVARLGRNF
jgi:hypothetical protein